MGRFVDQRQQIDPFGISLQVVLVARRSKVEHDQPIGIEIVVAADHRARVFAEKRAIRVIVLERDHGQWMRWHHQIEAPISEMRQKGH